MSYTPLTDSTQFRWIASHSEQIFTEDGVQERNVGVGMHKCDKADWNSFY
jgi:hypothetical protein